MPPPNLFHIKNMADNKLQQLFFYSDRGWPTFPLTWMIEDRCSCNSPSCKSPGKHPLVSGGFKTATLNRVQIETWHKQWPQANWGMRTGDFLTGGAGILVVDIDAKSNGFETWGFLRDEHPAPIETVSVTTGGGGCHLWFEYPSGMTIRSGAAVLGPGIDIRALDGYVLVPPSRTQDNYLFDLHPDDTKIEQCPSWVLARLDVTPNSKQLPAGLRIGPEVQQGERHQALLSLAGAMRRVGMTTQEIIPALQAIHYERFSPGDHPVTDEEIEAVVQWIGDKQPVYAPTDLGNGERFLNLYGPDVRYSYEWDKWLVWDGRKWAIDDVPKLMSMAHATVRSIYLEAAQARDEEQRRAIARHALLSEARPRVDNMLHSAKPYLAIRPDQLDQHPMYLNVANGIIDLNTGSLLPHDRRYLLTKILEIEYRPEAQWPEWNMFLDIVTGGDKDLQLFLQIAVGYTLTGRTDEHALFLLYGTGKNGKTTFTETIRRLMGDFARRVNIEALMQSWGTGQAASPYVADMAGARYVLASEIPENRKIDEPLVKDLTGGDAISARYLFSNPFTFIPTHKLWIFGNYKPQITGTDEGIWRRLRVIPFNVTIPEERRKPMSEVLQAFDTEMPGILAWAVAGSQLWLSQGLKPPEAVKQATLDYQNEQDLVQQFLEERCEMHSTFSVEKDVLYRAWSEWCEAAGEKEAQRRSKKWFTRQMTNRGFKHGGAGNQSLQGLKLTG